MRFKSYIQESFNTEPDYIEEVKITPVSAEYKYGKAGIAFHCMFNLYTSPKTISNYHTLFKNTQEELTNFFGKDFYNAWEVSRWKAGTMKFQLTGDGDVGLFYKGFLKCREKFIRRFSPSYMIHALDGKSRISLFKKFEKKFPLKGYKLYEFKDEYKQNTAVIVYKKK